MSDLITPIRKSAYVSGITKCNEAVMGYFEDELRRRRNTYKPKVKVTLEHKNDVGKLFKEILDDAIKGEL